MVHRMADSPTTNESELECNAVAMFVIPRRFELHEKSDGSWLRRLGFDDHKSRLTITKFEHGRTIAHIDIDESGNRIFLSLAVPRRPQDVIRFCMSRTRQAKQIYAHAC